MARHAVCALCLPVSEGPAGTIVPRSPWPEPLGGMRRVTLAFAPKRCRTAGSGHGDRLVDQAFSMASRTAGTISCAKRATATGAGVSSVLRSARRLTKPDRLTGRRGRSLRCDIASAQTPA